MLKVFLSLRIILNEMNETSHLKTKPYTFLAISAIISQWSPCCCHFNGSLKFPTAKRRQLQRMPVAKAPLDGSVAEIWNKITQLSVSYFIFFNILPLALSSCHNFFNILLILHTNYSKNRRRGLFQRAFKTVLLKISHKSAGWRRKQVLLSHQLELQKLTTSWLFSGFAWSLCLRSI